MTKPYSSESDKVLRLYLEHVNMIANEASDLENQLINMRTVLNDVKDRLAGLHTLADDLDVLVVNARLNELDGLVTHLADSV